MAAARRPLYDRPGGGRAGGRGGVDNLLDSIGWKHVFFLLAAYVILRPFLLSHPTGLHLHGADVKGGKPSGGAATGAAGAAEGAHGKYHHGKHGKRHGGGDAEGEGSSVSTSSGAVVHEMASVDDAVVEWEGPEPRGGAGLMQKLTAEGAMSESEALAAVASGGSGAGAGVGAGVGAAGSNTVTHLPSACCPAGLPQWASWVETQEQCRWECAGGHLVAVAGLYTSNSVAP
jgi:hypothetical protein